MRRHAGGPRTSGIADQDLGRDKPYARRLVSRDRHGRRRPATHAFMLTGTTSLGWPAFADHDDESRVPEAERPDCFTHDPSFIVERFVGVQSGRGTAQRAVLNWAKPLTQWHGIIPLPTFIAQRLPNCLGLVRRNTNGQRLGRFVHSLAADINWHDSTFRGRIARSANPPPGSAFNAPAKSDSGTASTDPSVGSRTARSAPRSPRSRRGP